MVRVAGLIDHVGAGTIAERRAHARATRSTGSPSACAALQDAAASGSCTPRSSRRSRREDIRIVTLGELHRRGARAPRGGLREPDPAGADAARGRPGPTRSRTSRTSRCRSRVIVVDPDSHERRFARVKVPRAAAALRGARSDGRRFVPLEEVIADHLDALFPGMGSSSTHPFRVTRDADLDISEDDAEDLLEAVEQELSRRRFGDVVRLEVDETMSDEILRAARRGARRRTATTSFAMRRPLDAADLATAREHSSGPSCATGRGRRRRRRGCSTRASRRRSTSSPRSAAATSSSTTPTTRSPTSVERFIEPAVDDPDVLAIKHDALPHRAATRRSSTALVRRRRAGQAGGRARRAEGALRRGAATSPGRAGWSDAGVHVVYGLVGLKTHASSCLVVRREGDGMRRYVHIGTGNYNPAHGAALHRPRPVHRATRRSAPTSRDLFNFLTGYSRQRRLPQAAASRRVEPARRGSSS